MLAKRVNCPETSSAGRWFDGAAALLGVREMNAFEGQAAMQLEALAQAHGAVEPDRSAFSIDADGNLDLLPLAERLADLHNAGFGAALFHATLDRGARRMGQRGSCARGHCDRRARWRLLRERHPFAGLSHAVSRLWA